MAQGVSYLGCAGWSLPRDAQPAFAPEGSHLQRYAQHGGGAAAHNALDLKHALDKEIR